MRVRELCAVACAGLLAAACGGEASRNEPVQDLAKTVEDRPADAVPAQPTPASDPADRYVAIRERLDAEPPPAAAELTAMQQDLLQIANTADDLHLRANASVLLGSLLEATGDQPGGIAHYRRASKLVPDDAGPFMALAVALARAGELTDALAAQQTATELDPDNLENWLALGELAARTGDQARATDAYIGYERRRKGLIDGLTLKDKQGQWLVAEEERIACAEALASANDAGTAVALLYSLGSEDAPAVRAAVARVMGIQRFSAYADPLTKKLATETDPDVVDAIKWALGEIAREPIDVEPGPTAALEPSDPRARPRGAGTKTNAE